MDHRPRRDEAFSMLCGFKHYYVKNQRTQKKPAIGIEPMTLALQMRCSNL